MNFTTSANTGNSVWIGVGEIFLGDGPGFTHGPSAFVDTTNAFHTYRIEVDGTTVGDPVRVFQDGVLRITGSLYSSSGFGSDMNIHFGDGTSYASGGAEWRAFRHNAGVSPSTARPRLFLNQAQTLTLHGIPGKNYSIKSVTSLTQTAWGGITNVSLTTNAFGFVEVPSGGSPLRFYRASELP